MLLVLANRNDDTAGRLVAAWSDDDVNLVTPSALSQPGWSYLPGAAINSGSIALDGRRLATGEIDGVYVRLPCVVEEDLPHIVAEDRSYVAAEMTAFLLSWLNDLRCPVVNRPVEACLAGPSWRLERWLNFASRRGIPVVTSRRDMVPGHFPPVLAVGAHGATVTVVGERYFGACHHQTALRAVDLARGAGADLLAATFADDGPDAHLIGAHVWPDVSEPAVAVALHELLLGRP